MCCKKSAAKAFLYLLIRCDYIWFCFSSVEKLPESFKPVTKRSNLNRVNTFDRHLTALTESKTESEKKRIFEVKTVAIEKYVLKLR